MKYTVIATKEIKTNLRQILNHVASLTNWPIWSPWACLDADATLDVKDDYMSWESEFTGSGSMQVIKSDDKSVDIDLNFIKPFKSKAQVKFKFEPLTDNSTLVLWQMNSKLPFFLFFWKKLFEVIIAMDFERGLIRLKYLCETGTVPTKLDFHDTPELIDSFKIAGVSGSCSMTNIGSSIHESFAKL